MSDLCNCRPSDVAYSRLDYCNAAVAGLPESTIRLLQRMQNVAPRLITNSLMVVHLHLVPVNQRIIYKLCLLMHLIHTN